MEFFHKNKRQFRIRQKRLLFVTLFLFSISILSIITTIFHANAEKAPIQSIEIFSEHTNFENSDPGAWKITKSADWTSKTTAKITLEIDSIPKLSGGNRDIILVLDNSSSMNEILPGSANTSSSKLNAIKQNTAELIQNTLDNQDSQIAIISFASDAEIISPFSNESAPLITALDSITAHGSTNYYKALSKVEEVLETHQTQNDKDIIVLFITDGIPVQQTPLEITKYYELKSRYNHLVINAIQYTLGDTVIPQLKRISDNQFIVQNAAQLDKSLFEAAFVPYYYSSFSVNDYIDTDYWTLNDISTSFGTATVSDDSATVNWDLGKYFRPGQEFTPKLTINLQLKPEFHESDDIFPTNTKETVNSSILDGTSEEITSTQTPALQHKYNVSYDANLPTGCTSSVTLPDTERYFVFDVVETRIDPLYCEGYHFVGWQIPASHIDRINDDYFIMPSSDTTIRGIWGMPSINKSMDGTIHERVSAIFDVGSTVNVTFKKLSGQNVYYMSYETKNDSIVAIKQANRLPADFATSDRNHIVSSPSSQVPIYAWFDDGIIYYYTDADEIFINVNSRGMFGGLTKLEDISIVSSWDTSNVVDMAFMFYENNSLVSLDPLENWNTSNAANMSFMFKGLKLITNIDALSKWDLSNVGTMQHMFHGAQSLENINGATNWNVSKVTDMLALFMDAKQLSDISGVIKWNTSNVTSMRSLFSGDELIESIDAVTNWNTSNVTNMREMFYNAKSIQSLDALANWDTSNVTDMQRQFSYNTSLTDISGVLNWNISSVTDMSYMFASDSSLVEVKDQSNFVFPAMANISGMFYRASSLSDISALSGWDVSAVNNIASLFEDANLSDICPIANWDVSNITNMQRAFNANKLTNLDCLSNWDVSNVTNMNSLFSINTGLTDISGISEWSVTNVTDMGSLLSSTSIADVDALAEWDTSNVTTMSGMFAVTSKLVNLDGLSQWNTSSLTNISGMFNQASALNNINALAGWDVSNVTDMRTTFNNTWSLTDIDALAEWDTSNVTTMENLLSNSAITNIDGALKWNTSKVKSMKGMFAYSDDLTNIDGASRWDTSSVTDMSIMFMTSRAPITDAISNWDTSSVTTMRHMFYQDYGVTNTDGLSNWDTSNVVDMQEMFRNASSLEDVSGLSNWNVENLVNTYAMFMSDYHITDLSPLENWNPVNLENMAGMFSGVPESATRPSWYNQ